MSKNQQMYRNKLNEIKGNHNTNLKPYPPLRWLLPLGQITASFQLLRTEMCLTIFCITKGRPPI